MKLKVGDSLAGRVFETADDRRVDIPRRDGGLVHIQFRRWVGCPICNMHLQGFRKRHGELEGAGVHEVVFFHSSAEDIRDFQKDMPFDMVGDPTKRYYREFGVESSIWFFLSVKTLWAAVRGVLNGWVNLKMNHGPTGLPADFLLGADGRVLAAKYGKTADDNWEVDDVLRLAKEVSR